MFRLNAFGQRVICNPYLRFIDPPEGGAGGDGGGGGQPEDLGFPKDTALTEMTVEQQAAYWRNQAKVQQKKADEKSDYDKLKADSEELARVKAKNATDEEKAIEEARREGENIGAERYLRDAVKGRFQALTGKTDEEVETAFAHIDPKSFVDDKGDIVADKLKTFADVFGKKDDSGKHKDPVAEALERQRQAASGSGSSISEKRKATRESMTKTKA
jgi:hypothetical protein